MSQSKEVVSKSQVDDHTVSLNFGVQVFVLQNQMVIAVAVKVCSGQGKSNGLHAFAY
jgi:hypothetical protein